MVAVRCWAFGVALVAVIAVAGCDSETDDGNGSSSGAGAGSSSSGTAAGGSSTGGSSTGGSSSGGSSTGGSGANASGGEGGEGGEGGSEPIVGLPYPERDAYRIKAIQPDFWPNKQQLADLHTGAVAINLVWASWESSVKAPPCAGSEQEYDGRCYQVDTAADQAIVDWTNLGVAVTAVVYGVPGWARTGNSGCSADGPAWFEMFCTPDDPTEYGRFAGMLSARYDGLNGPGRIADFVIHNEVNSNTWFDIGCGQGVACNQTAWIQAYADNYNAAYDAIKLHQSEARVLYSFDHHFQTDFDQPAAQHTLISVQTFITSLAPLVGAREWMVAYHPYPPDLLNQESSPLDFPRVTYGNMGHLLGWLRATFPSDPHAHKVQFTESGINSGAPSSEAAQGPAVCDSFRNTLGTPGVTSYIYHRLKDHPDEAPLQLGLVRSDSSYKPAWSVWANANLIDDNPAVLSCGFEVLPYTRLARASGGTFGTHWASSRLPPPGWSEEGAWYLARDEEAGTTELFECMVENVIIGEHTYLSTDVACGGTDVIMGPVGRIWTSQQAQTVALYQCSRMVFSWPDHFISTDSGCEGQTVDGLLGYARTSL